MGVLSWTDCQMDYAVGTYWYALQGAVSDRPLMPEVARMEVKKLR